MSVARRHWLVALVMMLAMVPALPGQEAPRPRRSQQAAVVQHFGTTRIEVRYSRPAARGRTLFGGLVPWNREWSPGADTATSLTLSAPVRLNGSPLAAGSYTIWTIPTESRWTIIISSAYPVWHLPYPRGRDVLRIEVAPRAVPHEELLTWEFPVVDGYTGELVMHWGTTAVPITIDASPLPENTP